MHSYGKLSNNFEHSAIQLSTAILGICIPLVGQIRLSIDSDKRRWFRLGFRTTTTGPRIARSWFDQSKWLVLSADWELPFGAGEPLLIFANGSPRNYGANFSTASIIRTSARPALRSGPPHLASSTPLPIRGLSSLV